MFYDNLKNECERQHLKVCPTITECGGTSGMIHGWKKGAFPNSDIVMKLAERLNVSTDYLLFGVSSALSSELTEKEKSIIKAYRKNKKSQKYVDRILNIEDDN